MSRTIQFYFDSFEGEVYGRADGEISFRVLDYEKTGEGGDFSKPLEYHLEKGDVFSLAHQLSLPDVERTRKIPNKIKNEHREFWGFPPLDEPIASIHIEEDGSGGKVWLEDESEVEFRIENKTVVFEEEAEVSDDVRRELSYIFHVAGMTRIKVPKEGTGNFIS